MSTTMKDPAPPVVWVFDPARLRAARVAAGYRSAAAAAQAAGLSTPTLYAWERGENPPPGDALARLATAYAVGVGEFYRAR